MNNCVGQREAFCSVLRCNYSAKFVNEIMKCFDLFFDMDLIDHVMQETNRYAQQYQIIEGVFFPSQSPVRSSYPATGNEMYNPQFACTDCCPKTYN
jgi:hypothetical protein